MALLALVAVGFVAYCLVDIARHPVRVLPRWAWVIVCLASVPLGGIVYLLVGRDTGEGRVDAVAAGEAAAPVAASPAPAARRARPARSLGEPIVATAALTKRYGSHAALDGVDLEVRQGSIFGLVGPNGSGKTTLLSLLAGLRRPTSGSMTLGGAAGHVAVLPDTPTFDAWLTAAEVVDLARSLTAPDLGPAAVRDALAEAGLADVADRRVGGFSRGMLQRLGLAATVVGRPELLLLDEPCSALDPLGRREVLDLIARLSGSATVLFCSHILSDVQEVCDTVGVLKDGRLLFQGSLDDLLVGHAAPGYTVRVRPPVAPVLEALARQPWVVAVEAVGAEQLEVSVRSVADAEANLPGVLAGAGARVVSVVPSAADLERVFLELVR